jgi:hypothetical protein
MVVAVSLEHAQMYEIQQIARLIRFIIYCFFVLVSAKYAALSMWLVLLFAGPL